MDSKHLPHNPDQQPYSPFKKIFIQRDYSKGTNIKFKLDYPEALNDYNIKKDEFIKFIDELNLMYKNAEEMNTKIFMESCFACLTAYITYLFFDTYFDKCLKKISIFIAEKNNDFFMPRGVQVIDPIERGLRVIEIVMDERKIEKKAPVVRTETSH